MEQDLLPYSEESNPNSREVNDKEHSLDVDRNSNPVAALRNNLVVEFNRNQGKEVSNKEQDPDSNQVVEDNSKVVLKSSRVDNSSNNNLRKMFSNSMLEVRPKRQQHSGPEEEANSNKVGEVNSSKQEDGSQLPEVHNNSKEEDFRNKGVEKPSKQLVGPHNNNLAEELNNSSNNLAEELNLANRAEEAGKPKRLWTSSSTMPPFRSLERPAETFQSFWRILSQTTTKLIR